MWTRTGGQIDNVVSSLKNHLRWKEEEPPRAAQAAHPTQNRTPWGERGGTSTETQLAEVREAHWRALATTIALEENIEWLSQSLTRGHQEACASSQSWDWWRRRSHGWSWRYCQVLPESSSTDSTSHSPLQREDEEAEFNLGPPPALGPDVEWFFHGPAGKYEEDAGNHFPAEPSMEE